MSLMPIFQGVLIDPSDWQAFKAKYRTPYARGRAVLAVLPDLAPLTFAQSIAPQPGRVPIDINIGREAREAIEARYARTGESMASLLRRSIALSLEAPTSPVSTPER